MDDQACDCCEGTEVLTPVSINNRPGLSALAYRVGTQARFFETMKARLSSQIVEPSQPSDSTGAPSQSIYPLSNLTTRTPDDASIALLDCWATVADVLTFYQERIANEGYLRTATERRSVLELARLVGYRLRPGVASSVYLAYTLDQTQTTPTVIPAGARSQSVPNPGELPQAFETSEALEARADWNTLKPRLAKPQLITLDNVLQLTKVYFEGTVLNLKPNDRLLFVFGDNQAEQVMRRVQETKPLFDSNQTEVTLHIVPFLIVAGAALIRVAITAIDKQIQLLANDPTNASLTRWLELMRDRLKVILENIFLDNYPPLDATFFSHDRLYGTATGNTTFRSPLAASPMAEFNRMFSATFSATPTARTTRKRRTATATAADAAAKGDNPWQSPSAMAVAGEVLDAALTMLQDAAFDHELACLASDVIDQARPASIVDRRALGALLSQAEERGVPKQIMTALSQLNTPQTDPNLEQLRLKALVGLSALNSLLQNKELFNSASAILTDLVDLSDDVQANSVHEFLVNAQAWLKNLTVIDTDPCESPAVTTSVDQLIVPLIKPPSLHPVNTTRLTRSIKGSFDLRSDAIPQLLIGVTPRLGNVLYAAWANATVNTAPLPLKAAYVFRTTAVPFGYNAQPIMALVPNTDNATKTQFPFLSKPDGDWKPTDPGDERSDHLFLDVAYDAILAGSYVVLQNSKSGNLAARINSAVTHPRTAYGLSGKTTELTLSRAWWQPANDTLQKIRNTAVYAQSEKLTPSTVPYTIDIQGKRIELDELYDGLESGRWLIVSGERADIPGTTGVIASELVMLTAVEQQFDPNLPGDKTTTTITLASDLAYRYKRETFTIYGNVVKATNGETRNEILGNGDGSRALQAFDLKQPPLTFVAAFNPSGVDSTLKVYVNDVQWHETDDLFSLTRTDHEFITKTNDAGQTTVVFGDGEHGSRLPTGSANVRAEYRNGLGKAGNVQAKQISLLVSRPLGVKEVINPLRASGGADKESRDQARKNVPLAVSALDRLVSVQDYADFARTFAGIAKASARRLVSNGREIVYLTIAGIDDVPIDATSDLYLNLLLALRKYGDVDLPVYVELRELLILVLSGTLYLKPDYIWEKVVAAVRAKLLDTFGFDQRDLGQDAVLSEAIATIESVPGVSYVDVDIFGAIPADTFDANGVRRPLTPQEIADAVAKITNPQPGDPPQPQQRVRADLADSRSGLRPAQLACLSPLVADTLILNGG